MPTLSESARRGRDTIKNFQTKFEPHIEAYFQKQLKRVNDEYDNGYSEYCIALYKEMCMRKAKRLRASFVYYVYKMYGGDNEKVALDMGVIVELMHANWLILDDFMDMSEMRRGGPAAHKILSKYHKDNNFQNLEAEHFGEAIAVNIGVVGIYMATNLLLGLDLENKTIKKLATNISQKMETTAHGQITDIFNSVGVDVTEENVLKMLKWKTGVYTYENPIHLGAIMAGASNEDLKILTKYAIPGGISFQIQDDILGMFGDASVMGKSAMDDLREGKYTLLVHRVLEKGTPEQKDILMKHLGNRSLSPEEHEETKKVMKDSGSLKYSQQKAKVLVEEAKTALIENKKPYWKEDGFSYLINIADYVIEREK